MLLFISLVINCKYIRLSIYVNICDIYIVKKLHIYIYAAAIGFFMFGMLAFLT